MSYIAPRLFEIRRFLPSDVDYVLKTWLRDQRHHVTRRCPDKLYYNRMQLMILDLAKKSDCYIACDPADHNRILGFCVGKYATSSDVVVVHYIYVRQEFRRLGIGKVLVESLGATLGKTEIVATTWNGNVDRFSRKDLIHLPLELWRIE